MKKNTLVKELLNNGVKLNELHCIFGFDFEKPFEIAKHNGKFTFNGLKKKFGFDDFVIIFKTESGYYQDRFILAHGCNNEFIFKYSTHSLWNCYSKSDFENERKQATDVYIIYQNPEYRTAIRCNKNCNGVPIGSLNTGYDLNDRFIVKDIISTIYQNNSKVYRTWDLRRYHFDKSGYIIDIKQSELKQRANAIRHEKSKIKADSVNLDFTIDEMRRTFDEKKKEATRLINNNDFGKLHISYLERAYSEMLHFIESYNKKSFTCYEDVTRCKAWFDSCILNVVK